MNRSLRIFTLLAAALPLGAAAFDIGPKNDPDRQVSVNGSVQVDAIFPEEENGVKYKETLLGNVYANAGLFSKYVDAGLRVEYLDHPMPAFYNETGFKGWGIGNFYATGKYKGFKLTAGDLYEQFGSGLILRTYEDRALGIDNAIRGGRLTVDAVKGFHLTLLGGVQRRYWDWTTKSRVYGADLEWQIQDNIKALERHGIVWTLGASWVQKRERYSTREDSIQVPYPDVTDEANPKFLNLNLPVYVNAFDVRTHFFKGNVDVLAEFAWKQPDPTADNNYTFSRGTALMLTATYSKRGFSAQVQAKRSEDMSFRTRRTMTDITSYINHLPPFAYQHTYTLAAMYPYATQYAPGEWAFQGNFALNIKRKTKLRLNLSYIRGIKREGDWKKTDDTMFGKDAVKTKFFGTGPLYYQDFNLQLDQKFSRSFSLNAMYMFQRYNQTVIEGHGGTVNAHIAVLEGKYKCSNKVTVRAEVQYLATKQDKGDWAFALAEVSVLPYLMFSVSDQINCGNGKNDHYYMVSVTGNYRNNRLMFGYGRTREGFNCSGGVCRYVPASRGFQLSYNYNF
ncbi:MAG: DUF6029 family protein [Bacteroides sp.]|nr:DUF6029 family protein [Bacteroides sp.]MCM1380069.1 DUF6029 family protein [Bacteroides sp.]MCM1446406.1 DUF6029 family protein [Prevotella sp.]